MQSVRGCALNESECTTFTVISLGAGLPRQKSHPFLDLLLHNVAANDAKAKPVG